MASGSLGNSAPAANTDTQVYIVPVGKVASWNISVFNRGDTPVSVRISKGSASMAQNEFLEYETAIPAKGLLERTALLASAGDRVMFRASTAFCTVMVYGYEEDA